MHAKPVQWRRMQDINERTLRVSKPGASAASGGAQELERLHLQLDARKGGYHVAHEPVEARVLGDGTLVLRALDHLAEKEAEQVALVTDM